MKPVSLVKGCALERRAERAEPRGNMRSEPPLYAQSLIQLWEVKGSVTAPGQNNPLREVVGSIIPALCDFAEARESVKRTKWGRLPRPGICGREACRVRELVRIGSSGWYPLLLKVHGSHASGKIMCVDRSMIGNQL